MHPAAPRAAAWARRPGERALQRALRRFREPAGEAPRLAPLRRPWPSASSSGCRRCAGIAAAEREEAPWSPFIRGRRRPLTAAAASAEGVARARRRLTEVAADAPTLPPPPSLLPLWTDLEDRTLLLLAEETNVDGRRRRRLEALLGEWQGALERALEAPGSAASAVGLTDAALRQMEDLYRAWVADHGAVGGRHGRATTTVTPSSNGPFRRLLRALAAASSRHRPDPGAVPRALDVFNEWNERLGGNLELAPGLEDYHTLLRVLRNCAGGAATTADGRGSDTDHRPADEKDDWPRPATVALEVLRHLEASGYDLAPTLRTYALAADCLGRAAVAAATTDGRRARDRDDNKEETDDTPATLLQVGMAQLMNRIERRLRPERDPPRDGDLLRYVQALCSAVACHGSLGDDVAVRQWWSGLGNILLGSEGPAQLLSAARASDEGDDGESGLRRHLEAATTGRLRSVATLPRAQRATDLEAVLSVLDTLRAMFPAHLPTLYHYHAAIRALKGVSGAGASHCRHRLIDEMEARHEALSAPGGDVVDPHSETQRWNLLMAANFDAGRSFRVNQIWKHMSASTGIHRNQQSFAIQLKALADIGTGPAAMQAFKIWKRTLNANLVTLTAQDYASVMVALCRSRLPTAAEHCRRVLERLRMEASTNEAMAPTVVHYSALIASEKVMQPATTRALLEEMRGDGVQPDGGIYLALLLSLSRVGSVEAAELCESLIHEMENHDSLAPNASCYASAMHAWSSTSEGYAKCSSLLNRLEALARLDPEGVGPLDSTPYLALLAAATKQDATSAGDVADEILVRVKRAAGEGVALEPDNRLYTSVMTAHGKSRPEPSAATLARLRELLQEMEQAFASGNDRAKPDAHATTVLLQAYAWSAAADKARVCWGLLQRMMAAYERDGDLDQRPTAHAFGAVLGACAHAPDDGSPEPLDIALQVVEVLGEGRFDHPNAYTYHNFLRVVARRVADPHERSRLAGTAFQRCCAEGCVDRRVLAALRAAAPGLHRKLPVDPATRRVKVPAEWTRRVTDGETSR